MRRLREGPSPSETARERVTIGLHRAFGDRLRDFDVVVVFASKKGDRRPRQIVCVETDMGKQIMADALESAGRLLRAGAR